MLFRSLAMGFCVAFILIPAQTLLQEETPMDMLGRVSSSLMSVLSMAQVIALAFAGTAAQWIGIRNLYFVSAALLVGIAGFGAMRLRSRAPTPVGSTPPAR